jgi:hypothetical protein
MVTVDLAKEGRNSTFATTRSTNEETGNSRLWGVDWGEETKSYKSGDRRLLLRTLPLSISSKESRKRADCHLWPKGTFIQLKIGDEIREHVVKITQRQQQHHEVSALFLLFDCPYDLCHITDIIFSLLLSHSRTSGVVNLRRWT